MTINTKEFREVVKKLKPAIIDDDTNIGSMLFITEDLVYCYNEQTRISVPFTTGLRVVLSATDISKFLNKFKEKTMDITVGTDNIKITTTNKATVSTTFKTYNEKFDKVAIIPDIPNNFEKLPEDFFEGLKLCVGTAMARSKKRYLNYLYIKDNVIASTDNFRVAQYEMTTPIDKELFIHSQNAKQLLTYNTTLYTTDEYFIHFATEDDVIFSCKLGEDIDFPLGYKEMFGWFKSSNITIPKEVRGIVDIASITQDDLKDIDKTIDVIIKDNTITCKASDKRKEVMGSIPIESANDFKFKINPKFFHYILGICDSISVNLEEEAILFENDKYKHLLTIDSY